VAARATTVETILKRLAAAGRRRSAPRQAIVEMLVGAKGHVTADELAEDVQRRFPSVNISTVYRTLDTLEELGIVDHVHLGHGRAIYHLTDDDHQHLVCESCEMVEEIPLAKLRPFFRTLEKEHDFEVDRRHFAIVGVCRRCRTKKSP
jgi:Fur family transcriptional regulator, ferric uptake regulator